MFWRTMRSEQHYAWRIRNRTVLAIIKPTRPPMGAAEQRDEFLCHFCSDVAAVSERRCPVDDAGAD